MRICDVTDAYHATSGGIRTYIDQKIRCIRSSTDFEHVLVVPAARDHHEQDGRTQVFGVASPRIPGCSPYRVMLRHGRIADILDRVRPDVIELGNPYFQPRAARRFKARYAAVLAGFYHTDFPRAYVEATLGRRLGARVARSAGKAASRYARYVHANLDFTIVSSPALERRLSWLGFPRVELVPLGVDTELFHPGKRDFAWRRQHGVLDEDLLLVFAGRLDREKRIGVLLDMMERLPPGLPAKLAILGQGPQASLVERAAAENPRILALPFEQDRSRFARCLASADIYVSAARFETFGLSVIEAQASGLPVVGQRAGAMIDRVPPSTGILVSEPDPEALAAAVVRITQDDFREMGRIARRLVETQNTWDRTFTRLFGLYEAGLRTPARNAHAPRSV